jgi:hypothetical protein
MLGWDEGAWGYHGDDGLVYEFNDRSVGLRLQHDGETTYGKEATVGCGVDFGNEKAFFTKDGKLLGTGTGFEEEVLFAN